MPSNPKSIPSKLEILEVLKSQGDSIRSGCLSVSSDHGTDGQYEVTYRFDPLPGDIHKSELLYSTIQELLKVRQIPRDCRNICLQIQEYRSVRTVHFPFQRHGDRKVQIDSGSNAFAESIDDATLPVTVMDWRGYERAVFDLLKCLYPDALVVLTPPQRDGGVDILIDDPHPIHGGTTVCQVKMWDQKVTRPMLQQLRGVMADQQAANGLFVAASGFTRDAEKYADGARIQLLDGEKLNGLLAQHGIR
ncbi:MAG: restriction endonuclease [bacterium]